MYRFLVFSFLACCAFSCKKMPFGTSSLADKATSESFRSGFPQPKQRSEYSVFGKTAPLSVREFTDKARAVSGKTLVLAAGQGVVYGVTSTSEGEQILLMMSLDDLPTPVASISNNTLYSFGMHVSSRGGSILANELFVKSLYGTGEAPLEPQNMYVRRSVQTSGSTSEAVLVPWLNHVRSEVGSTIVFRIGNTIVDSRSGSAILEFRPLDETSWIVIGSYKDADVEAGTVFWRDAADGERYFSLTPGRQNVVRWSKQIQVGDKGDSIDRIDVAALSSVKTPAVVKAYLEGAPQANDPAHPKNMRPEGFNWYEGDAGVIQLNRNSRIFLEPAPGASLLSVGTSNWSGGSTALLGPQSQSAQMSGLGLWWGSAKNKPVTLIADSGVGYRGAVWTDENGVQRGGAVLAERNVWQSGSAFSDGAYEKRYYVKNRTTGSYAEVRADGTVARNDISDAAFRGMMRTSVNIEQMQKEGGAPQRQINDANQLGARANRQLERSMSLRPGSSVAGMASNMAVDNGINIAQWTLASGQPAGAQAAIILGANGLQEGVNVLRDKDGRTAEESIVALGERTLVDSAIAGSTAFGRSQGSVGIGQLGVAAVTAADAYNTRAREGDFDPNTNPDYFFDSSVSGAAVAGRGVTGAASYLIIKDMEAGPLRAAAASTTRAVLNDGLLNTTEALSRASYAETLSKQRGEILEDVSQVRRDSFAAQSALSTLDQLDSKGE